MNLYQKANENLNEKEENIKNYIKENDNLNKKIK